MQVAMDVTGLTIDPVNNAPVVVLREREGSRVLPIWIGVVEASAIAFELEKVKLTRPMTHDLLRTSIESLGGKVERVLVVDLRENTYYAVVVLAYQGQSVEIDARPSDAIALALRAKAPILCEDRVIQEAMQRQTRAADAPQQESAAPSEAPGDAEEMERGEGGPQPIVGLAPESMQDLLEQLSPEAFGKYKM